MWFITIFFNIGSAKNELKSVITPLIGGIIKKFFHTPFKNNYLFCLKNQNDVLCHFFKGAWVQMERTIKFLLNQSIRISVHKTLKITQFVFVQLVFVQLFDYSIILKARHDESIHESITLHNHALFFSRADAKRVLRRSINRRSAETCSIRANFRSFPTLDQLGTIESTTY